MRDYASWDRSECFVVATDAGDDAAPVLIRDAEYAARELVEPAVAVAAARAFYMRRVGLDASGSHPTRRRATIHA